MLRWTVALVIVANLLFFAWTRGWLTPLVGVGPQGDHDPQRLLQQVHPERVDVLSPEAASAATAPGPASSSAEPASATSGSVVGETTDTAFACMEAGPYAAADLRAAQAVLSEAGVAPEGAQTISVAPPAVWLVYMGRFTDPVTLQRKQEELQRRHVGFQELHGAPQLEPGLSLGRFGDRAAADDALVRLNQHGVHTARVVELPAPAPLQLLRLRSLTLALAARLQTLSWPAAGPGLRACAPPPKVAGSASATAG